MPHLVIVESPAKAKTIGKYLGDQYRVKATMGHLRDLPRSGMGVDSKTDFTMHYQPVAGKEKTIAELRAEARKAERIYLATDPDREGEAISWHVKELLELPDEKVLRVTFNEITKKVVRESIEQPRALDINLIDAQQARRALDRIVGYELSPLLWRKIRPGLSAGRVQSVATRLVVDREEEIRAFTPEEYWSLAVKLSRLNGEGSFTGQFYGRIGEKIELKSQEMTEHIMQSVQDKPFVVQLIKKGEKKRHPAPPFITSSLQQEASRRLNMGPRRTMVIAQQLYEGVELQGRGLMGLITYMRTDSLRLSDEAINAARDYIRQSYGASYVPSAPRHFKSKKGSQDAHEAIRPSDPALSPQSIKDDLSPDQYKLYKLIWSRFMACQMESAVFDTLSIEVVSEGYVFRAHHQSVKFPGFTALYEESRDEEEEAPQTPLPHLKEGEAVRADEFLPEQHFTQPPPRYTEASLIRAMEEKGIGRPSTYAPTISTILDREYVRRQGKTLSPTPLGEVVTLMMKERFADIIDIAFTARMEDFLDDIEEGRKQWKAMLQEFYGGFSEDVKNALENPQRYKIPDEPTDVICEHCGKNMVIKVSRFGRFMACPGYPECKNAKPITEPTPGECPQCGATILKKKSKNQKDYYGCERFPECTFMTWDAPLGDRCPECTKTLFKRSGRGAMKPFCTNPTCPAFVPEDQRGYKRKPKTEDGAASTDGASAEGKTAKPAVKKTVTKGKATPKAKSGTTKAKTAATKTAGAKKTTKTKAATGKKTTAAKTTTKSKTTTKKTTATKKKTAGGESADV